MPGRFSGHDCPTVLRGHWRAVLQSPLAALNLSIYRCSARVYLQRRYARKIDLESIAPKPLFLSDVSNTSTIVKSLWLRSIFQLRKPAARDGINESHAQQRRARRLAFLTGPNAVILYRAVLLAKCS